MDCSGKEKNVCHPSKEQLLERERATDEAHWRKLLFSTLPPVRTLHVSLLMEYLLHFAALNKIQLNCVSLLNSSIQDDKNQGETSTL